MPRLLSLLTTPVLRQFLLVAGLAVLAGPAVAQAPDQAAVSSSTAGYVASPMPTLAPILEQVSPAVVNISTVGQAPQRNPLFDDPFFRRFYNVPDQPAVQEPQALGSGVVVDADQGLIVTNSHVIEHVGTRAARILVTLSDGREVGAELVGNDPRADIAVIRIDADDLVDIPWGDSSRLRVGDFCLAIGNPFGLGQSVTSGIVSALGRSGLGIEDFEDFIQTDASINPGNSGGALIGLDGKLIGINTAIVGPAGGNVGIGFAIPSNLARDLVEQLLEFGEVRRGALGVAAQPLTPEVAEAFGVEPRSGVLISRVRKGSPADLAGLQPGDIVTAIDGERVRDMDALRNRIGLVRLGQQLRLDVLRDGETRTIRATVAELQLSHPLFEGVAFEELTAGNGRPYVALEEVEAGSPVARAGLEAGDIILSVNKQSVATVEQLDAVAGNVDGDLLLLIQRGRATRYARLTGD